MQTRSGSIIIDVEIVNAEDEGADVNTAVKILEAEVSHLYGFDPHSLTHTHPPHPLTWIHTFTPILTPSSSSFVLLILKRM